MNIELEIPQTKMALDAYPSAIFQNVKRLADVEHQIAQVKRAIANHDSDIEYAVAFDPDLKNDLQRKATIAYARGQHIDYQSKLIELDELNTERAVINALLELLRSEQSIAKLGVQLAIASRMGGAESVNLLGV